MTPSLESRLDPDQERARDLVRALGPPAADPAFRRRLRAEFAAGSLAPAAGRVLAFPGAARRWARTAVTLAAAAAAVIAILVLNRGPDWELVGAGGDGVVMVGPRPVPLGHREELARLLRPGVTLRVATTSDLELALPGQLAMQITPGSEITLPRAPGRWLERRTAAELARGEVRITTGAGFRGARLDITTPEAAVQVTGTTLAVIREPAGTCVCVLEGTVRVGPKRAGLDEVPAGMRRFVFQDGSPPELAEIRADEISKLGMFRDRHRREVGPSR